MLEPTDSCCTIEVIVHAVSLEKKNVAFNVVLFSKYLESMCACARYLRASNDSKNSGSRLPNQSSIQIVDLIANCTFVTTH